MTQEQIEELRKLAQDATPGPWVAGGPSFGAPLPVYCDEVVTESGGDSPDYVCRAPFGENETSTADMSYIAAANPSAILALIQQRDELLVALELFMERVDEPPEANCSCHLSPPCNDCVENWGLREAFSAAKEAIAKAEAQS